MISSKDRKSPFPTGVENGPLPTTARGWRRRARKNDKEGQMGGYKASDYHSVNVVKKRRR